MAFVCYAKAITFTKRHDCKSAFMNISLHHNQSVFFASDFHLGAPDYAASRVREDKIIRWLSDVEKDAAAIFLLGDIFDFWFEDRKSTRLNSSHVKISYAVFCLKKKNQYKFEI